MVLSGVKVFRDNIARPALANRAPTTMTTTPTIARAAHCGSTSANARSASFHHYDQARKSDERAAEQPNGGQDDLVELLIELGTGKPDPPRARDPECRWRHFPATRPFRAGLPV